MRSITNAKNTKGFTLQVKKSTEMTWKYTMMVFAIDEENLRILRAKIMAVLIDDLPPKEKKSILNQFFKV